MSLFFPILVLCTIVRGMFTAIEHGTIYGMRNGVKKGCDSDDV